MRASHQLQLRKEDLQPASGTLRIVPIRSEATFGAGNVALGDLPNLASCASLAQWFLPGQAKKFSPASAEGSHRSHMPSGSWKSMRPLQKVWLSAFNVFSALLPFVAPVLFDSCWRSQIIHYLLWPCISAPFRTGFFLGRCY